MIWIDSSFAVEWLLGEKRAKAIKLPAEPLGILPIQYAETFTFFLKKGLDTVSIANELEGLELQDPEKIHLQIGANLYFKARQYPRNKASLADAILAAVAQVNNERVIAFDQDFASLGLKQEKNGIWHA